MIEVHVTISCDSVIKYYIRCTYQYMWEANYTVCELHFLANLLMVIASSSSFILCNQGYSTFKIKYRTIQNFGGRKFWRNDSWQKLADNILANAQNYKALNFQAQLSNHVCTIFYLHAQRPTV